MQLQLHQQESGKAGAIACPFVEMGQDVDMGSVLAKRYPNPQEGEAAIVFVEMVPADEFLGSFDLSWEKAELVES